MADKHVILRQLASLNQVRGGVGRFREEGLYVGAWKGRAG